MDVEGSAETDSTQVNTSTGKGIPDKPVKKSPFKRIKLKRARNTIHSINRKPHQDKQVVKNLMDDLSEIELSPDDPQSVDSDRNSLSNSGVARIRNFHVEIERLKVNDQDRKIMRNYIKKRRLKENRKSQRNRDRKKINSKKRLRPVRKCGRRLKRCYECETCKIPDCRKCILCKDMKKYGGKGIKKQACMMRPKCLLLEETSFN